MFQKVKVLRGGPISEDVQITPARPIAAAARRAAQSDAPTVYQMSLASGMSKKEACEFAKGMDPFGCRTQAEFRRAQVAKRISARAQAKAAKYLDSDCYDHVTTKGDGSKHNHACYTRYLDFKNKKIKLIGVKMKATGWSKDPGWFRDRITSVGMKLNWEDDASYAVDWAPYSTQTQGSCRSTTTTVTSPKSGTSYSSTTEVCPDKLTPWHSPAFQNFGAKWNGDETPEDERRGVVASAVHKLGVNAYTGVYISSHLSWS